MVLISGKRNHLFNSEQADNCEMHYERPRDYLEKVFNVPHSIIIILNASNVLLDRWLIYN